MIPVIFGPKERHYVIDHHHLSRALLEEGEKQVLVTVVADLRALEPDAFWVVLDHRGWVHPYDENGERRGFRAIPKSVGDLLEGGLPRDGLESSLALGPHAPERRAHASGRVEPLRVVVHLAADHALGEGMGRVARDVGHAAVLDGDGQGALRRAIVRTDGPARFTHGGSSVTHVV